MAVCVDCSNKPLSAQVFKGVKQKILEVIKAALKVTGKNEYRSLRSLYEGGCCSPGTQNLKGPLPFTFTDYEAIVVSSHSSLHPLLC